jgi:rfaE bifunctional protein kinase chain/domain
MNNCAEEIRKNFPDKKIVIVGDIVADQFLRGTIDRVSREAPVFILRHDETETLAGGAGNAAANVASLGANAVLVGVIGKDINGTALLKSLRESKINCDHLIATDKIQTTTKVRVLAGQQYAPRQQVIRIDYGDRTNLDSNLIEQLKQSLSKATETAQAIIISDYNYGVANAEIAGQCALIAGKKGIPLLIDSRFRLEEFSGATTATPNHEEVEQILGENFTEEDCAGLQKRLKLEALLITLGNKGMLLIENGQTPVHIEVVGSKEPVDVTGAGDTVIATYALGLATGLGFRDSAGLANHAGGIAVMKKGTATVKLDELTDSLDKNSSADFKTQHK